MGITDFILGRKKRDMDYGDVKSQVLGRSFVEQPETVGSKFGIEKADEFPRDPYAPEPFTSPPSQLAPPYPERRQEFADEPFRPEPRMAEFERRDFPVDQPPRRDMDILDRLSIIEAQLTAIRSQTETINERLKNIDARLGTRRY